MLVLRRGLVHDEVSDLVEHLQTLVLLRLQSTCSAIFDLYGSLCDFLALAVARWRVHRIPAVLVTTEHLSALGAMIRILQLAWNPIVKLYYHLVGTDGLVK